MRSGRRGYGFGSALALVRLGIFGGTFDPPHVGHLLVAQDALAALELDSLVFIPASQQPLKVGRCTAPPEARLEMVRRMVDGVDGLSFDALEVDRPGLSYSVDTLSEYAMRFPTSELFFLLGMDAGRSLPSWREPHRIAKLARFVLMERAAAEIDIDTTAVRSDTEETMRQVTEIVGHAEPPILISTRRIDISSTEIRERASRGASLRGFVTDEVARFIAVSGLYR